MSERQFDSESACRHKQDMKHFDVPDTSTERSGSIRPEFGRTQYLEKSG